MLRKWLLIIDMITTISLIAQQIREVRMRDSVRGPTGIPTCKVDLCPTAGRHVEDVTKDRFLMWSLGYDRCMVGIWFFVLLIWMQLLREHSFRHLSCDVLVWPMGAQYEIVKLRKCPCLIFTMREWDCEPYRLQSLMTSYFFFFSFCLSLRWKLEARLII